MTTTNLRKLKLGMVGGGLTGSIGEAHRIAARMHNLYDLTAAAFSSNPETAHESAKVLGVARSYESYEEMLQKESQRDDGIEVVAIVTPNDLHVGPAIAFAKAGVDVICDKPLSDTYQKALELEKVIKAADVEFILTHNYTGYPLVRQAKVMIENGDIGNLRQVRISYLQDGVIRNTKNKTKLWRGNPERCGPAGTVADIGSHAYHMLRFVTGVDIKSIAAELRTHTKDRILDDHCESLLRFENGAIGSLTCSQVSIGKKCEFNFEIYGDKGSLHWGQEEPNEMIFCEYGKPKQILQRAMPYLSDAATPVSNIATGHTEGYYEAFAQIYRDAHSLITARRDNVEINELVRKLTPNIDDGMAVARYINATVQSAKNNSAWVDLDSINA